MPRQSIISLGQHHGFTLVEVLVVLAIMVILFGMLFVPITTSLEMTHTAQQRTQLNQTMRLAMEQIRRELSDAAAIYLPEIIPRGDGTGTYIVNYSNITFIPLSEINNPTPRVVRYAVHTPATQTTPVMGDGFRHEVSTEPGPDNPFVLYRQEGYMRRPTPTSPNYFGPVPLGSPDEFIVGMPSSENAMTPVRNADIPVTQTICLDSSGVYIDEADGYVKSVNDISSWASSGGQQLVYIHGGIQFTPLRVEGERMQIGANRTIYTAQHGHWAGQQNDGSASVADIVWGSGLIINSSELRPRIQVPRALLDTDTLDPNVSALPVQDDGTGTIIYNMFDLRWDSVAGTVSTWLPYLHPVQASVTFNGLDSPLGPGSTWDITGASIVTTPSGPVAFGSIDPVPVTDVYTVPGERRAYLIGAPVGNVIPVRPQDIGELNDGEDVTIVNHTTGADEPLGAIIGIDTIANTITTTNTPTPGFFGADDWLRADEESRKAYSTYQITLPEDVAGTPDKMIIPESVRVWAVGENVLSSGTTEQAVLEYNRVSFVHPASPTQDELDSIGPQQFAIKAAGGAGDHDYRKIQIQFGNSKPGPDGVRVPPPSPDDPSTYGAPSNWKPGATDPDDSLDSFYIWVEYQYRRNFDTSNPDVNTYDFIDVSYSTQEVYNIALEVMPYRELEDQDGDGVWQPFGDATGVQMRGQVEVRNLSR